MSEHSNTTSPSTPVRRRIACTASTEQELPLNQISIRFDATMAAMEKRPEARGSGKRLLPSNSDFSSVATEPDVRAPRNPSHNSHF